MTELEKITITAFNVIRHEERIEQMTNYEYSKIGEPSEKAIDTIESMFEDLHILECEKKVYKDLVISLIRSERLNAAVEYYEMLRYNK